MPRRFRPGVFGHLSYMYVSPSAVLYSVCSGPVIRILDEQ